MLAVQWALGGNAYVVPLSAAPLCRREPSLFAVMDAVLAYGGMAKRVGDLYASRSILSKARTMIQGLKVRRGGACVRTLPCHPAALRVVASLLALSQWAAGRIGGSGGLFCSRKAWCSTQHLLQGADNVFTQHTPLLTATLTNFLADRLDVAAYPFMGLSQVRAPRSAPPAVCSGAGCAAEQWSCGAVCAVERSVAHAAHRACGRVRAPHVCQLGQ